MRPAFRVVLLFEHVRRGARAAAARRCRAVSGDDQTSGSVDAPDAPPRLQVRRDLDGVAAWRARERVPGSLHRRERDSVLANVHPAWRTRQRHFPPPRGGRRIAITVTRREFALARPRQRELVSSGSSVRQPLEAHGLLSADVRAVDLGRVVSGRFAGTAALVVAFTAVWPPVTCRRSRRHSPRLGRDGRLARGRFARSGRRVIFAATLTSNVARRSSVSRAAAATTASAVTCRSRRLSFIRRHPPFAIRTPFEARYPSPDRVPSMCVDDARLRAERVRRRRERRSRSARIPRRDAQHLSKSPPRWQLISAASGGSRTSNRFTHESDVPPRWWLPDSCDEAPSYTGRFPWSGPGLGQQQSRQVSCEASILSCTRRRARYAGRRRARIAYSSLTLRLRSVSSESRSLRRRPFLHVPSAPRKLRGRGDVESPPDTAGSRCRPRVLSEEVLIVGDRRALQVGKLSVSVVRVGWFEHDRGSFNHGNPTDGRFRR